MKKIIIILIIAIVVFISGYKLLSKSEYSSTVTTTEKSGHHPDAETTISMTDIEDIKEESAEIQTVAVSKSKANERTDNHKLIAKEKDIAEIKPEESDKSIKKSETGSYKVEAVSDKDNVQSEETSNKSEAKIEKQIEKTTESTQPEKDTDRKPTTEAATEARTEAKTESVIQNDPEIKTQTPPEVIQPTTKSPAQNATEATTQAIVESTTQAICNHNWVWKTHTETVHHEAEYTEYLICEAYDENIYESHTFCNNCNLDMTINFGGASSSEAADHMLNVCGGCGYHSGQAVVGTIHHDAEYGSYCSAAPYDEYVEVNDYQYCSICGERR